MKKRYLLMLIFIFLLFCFTLMCISYAQFSASPSSPIGVSGVSTQCEPSSGYDEPCHEECGGMLIEGKCYDCGANDNICPEDFGVDCKIEDPDCEGDGITPPEPSCVCSDFTSEDDCNSAVCDGISCYWTKGWIFSGCKECDTNTKCSDYKSESTCTKDNCGLENCVWNSEDEECIESTLGEEEPAALDCGDISSCSDYTDELNCNDNVCELTLGENIKCLWYSGDDNTPEGCYECYICIIDDEEWCVQDENECNDLKDSFEEAQDAGVECDCEIDCDPEQPTQGCEGFCDDFCKAGVFQAPPGDGYRVPSEEVGAFPLYDNWELIITVLVLICYYLLIHKRLIKKW